MTWIPASLKQILASPAERKGNDLVSLSAYYTPPYCFREFVGPLSNSGQEFSEFLKQKIMMGYLGGAEFVGYLELGY
ncbi:hypothetical protein CEXT_274971 [Caerostris extrusa]|uniref:Uncharacterized protein n=1 Tax=Caerostris extrusa TaxID=172846 RepID=A0AAV4MMZ9_CAEEX|nr:hypothetical protein CEXT_274971 [Caerostris extrusa]